VPRSGKRIATVGIKAALAGLGDSEIVQLSVLLQKVHANLERITVQNDEA
jgi:hypothetical protein